MVLDEQQLLWDRFIAGLGFRSGGRRAGAVDPGGMRLGAVFGVFLKCVVSQWLL